MIKRKKKSIKKDIKSDDLMLNDYVEFSSKEFLTANNIYNIARFVNKLTLRNEESNENKMKY